tara:strand:- start:308 stop:553 length:246 start_codon:yes stop_codon:yes gene_type:complete
MGLIRIMKTSSKLLIGIAGLLALPVVYVIKKYVGQSATPGAVRVGDQLEHTFARPLFDGRGVQSLQDLRGSPVMILIWGKN